MRVDYDIKRGVNEMIDSFLVSNLQDWGLATAIYVSRPVCPS